MDSVLSNEVARRIAADLATLVSEAEKHGTLPRIKSVAFYFNETELRTIIKLLRSCHGILDPAQCDAARLNGGDWAQLLMLRDVMKAAYSRGGDRLMSVWERDLNAVEAAIALLESLAKATEGKAGMAGGTPTVRRSTAGTGLRVGAADAVQPATSEIMDVTAGETAPNSDCLTPAAWECQGRKQALPEPADCNWPDCGCDPHATKVIESLLEQGWCDGTVTRQQYQKEIAQLRAQVEKAKASLTETAANLVGSAKDVDDPAIADTLRRLADIKLALSHSSTMREGE